LTVINDLFTDSTEEEIDEELAFELGEGFNYVDQDEEST
jgi:hypothetical protein